VPDGTYTAVIEARDTVGNVSRVDLPVTVLSALRGVTLSATVFSPVGGPQSSTVEVTYTLLSAATVSVEVHGSAGIVRHLQAPLAQGAGTYTLIWDGRNDSAALVSDGDYAVVVTATTGVGTSVRSRPVRVDTVSPAVTGLTAGPDPFVADGTWQFSWDFDLSEPSLAWLIVVNGKGEVVHSREASLYPAGAATLAWDGRDPLGNLVPGGTYNWSLWVKDQAGNKASPYPISSTLQVSPLRSLSVAPAVFSPYGGKRRHAVVVRYALSVTATVEVGVAAGETPLRTLLFPSVRGAGSYVITWDGRDSGGALMDDGIYDIVVTVTTTSGSITLRRPVELDSQAPTVSDVVVAPSPFLANGSTTCGWSFDLSEAADATLIIRDGSGALVANAGGMRQGAGAADLEWDGRDMSGNLVAAGTYVWQLYVADPAGNKATAWPVSSTLEVTR
jgi:flagellar hook assembly protein FlgD